MKAVLASKEVLEVVLGTSTKPAATETEKLKAWKKADATAMMILSESLDDEHHSFIRSCASSKEMWTTITGIKEQATVSTKLLVSQEFHGYRYEPGMTMSTFLAGLNVIIGKMESLDVTVDDSSKVGKVIHCLPQEFDTFRQSWRLTCGTTGTFVTLQSQFLAAEADMKARDPIGTSAGEAFFGKPDHSMKGLKQGPTVKKNDVTKEKFKAKCFFCKKPGHKKADCYKWKAKQGSSDSKQESASYNVGDAFTVADGQEWLGDSGAFAHITKNRQWFSSFRSTDPKPIRVGGDKILYSTGVGTIDVEVFNGKKWNRSKLKDVRYVPEFGSANLFSLGSAVNRGVEVAIDKSGLRLIRNGKVEVVGRKTGNTLFTMAIRTLVNPSLAMVTKPVSLKLWHERFGHVDTKKIKTMAANGLVGGLEVEGTDDDSFFCKGCVLGAMTKRSHKSILEPRNCKPGEYIHTDLCGPFGTASVGGSWYYVCYKDESTGYRRIYFLKDKSQVLDTFKSFVAEAEVETGNRVKLIRSDNGTEFRNQNFDKFCLDKGIVREYSPAYNPQSNGRAERENRTLVEKASSMIHAKDLPLRLWACYG